MESNNKNRTGFIFIDVNGNPAAPSAVAPSSEQRFIDVAGQPTSGYTPVIRSPYSENNSNELTVGTIFQRARTLYEKGESEKADTALKSYLQLMRTAGSPYYQPYYTSFNPDEKYESDTLEVEQALRDMYQDVRVAVAKGYSDAWIASNITSGKYKALKAADEAVVNGNPKKYTRQIPYLGADTVYGMIYQARNGDEYNSDIFSDVARYYMGYGKQYVPDDTEQAIRDRTSDKWNPYAFGGASASPTMNSLCGKYGVMGFTREWAQKHANELESNGDRDKVFKIIEDTEKAEAEYKRLQETIAQRLRDGESIDDVYNLYFGNNMAYLKSGRKGDVLDDGEEGYATLFNMEYKRQQQGAYDLAWEVPFSSYGIKDWMAGEVAAMQREKEDAEYQTFYDAVPEDYRGAVLSLYARDKGLKKSEFSAEDLPEINAWIEEKGLAQQTDENVQGPVQSYGDRLYSFAQAQRAERAETVEPTPNFTASEFLTQVNEQDKDGNKTMDAANANADFQLGLQDYYAGLPVDDPNVKAFTQKYAFLMGDTGRTVTDSGDAGSLISFDNTTSFENNRGSVLKGGRESTWLTEAEKTFGVDSPEWAQTLLTYANAYDQWVDSGASKSLSFDAFVDQTPELWEQIATVHEDIQAAKAKAQETEAANKVETANKNNAILNRVANGEQLEDYRDSYAWAAIQRQDVRDAKENDAGYKSALDSLTAYGAEFLQGNSATTGTDYWADNFRRNENEFICAEAGKQIDQLMKAAQASGMSFDEYCKAVNIDADTFAQSAYATAYTDYREALDVGVQVAQAVGELSKDELKNIYKTNKMRDKADEWNQEPVLQELLSQGRITQQQYDDFKRLYDDNDTNGGVLTGGDNLLRMAGSQVMGGKDRTLVEGEDRQSVAQELFNTQRDLRLDERKDYQKGVSGTSELVATGDSGNVGTVLWNAYKKGSLTFGDSWVVAAMGWLGRDRAEIEAKAREQFSRDEYRALIENGIRESVHNEELYEQYRRQLDNYTGDIYKFDFDNRTIGLQSAHANLSANMQALDEEMAAVLTPDAYNVYKYTAFAVNSFELSIPTMIISTVTHGAAVPQLIAQLSTTGFVEGGQTAYELQQAGVSAGASKGAGLMVGGLTALSEWGLDDLVTGMTYKSGIVKAINGVTDINAASRALAIANAVYSKTGSEGLAALAKYSGYALFGTAQGAIKMGVGAVGESLQEVQQEATADFLKTQYGQRMKDVDAYAQVFKDSFFSGLIQSAGTGMVRTVRQNVDTIRANNAITKETFNEMAGEALSVEGALAQRQAYLDEKQRGMEELQNELNALYAEREAGQQILEDAESYARMMQDEASMSIDEALKLNTSELVQSIKQDQAESAELGNMLAEFERMIDEDNAMVEMAREPIERGNPTEAELSQFDEAVGIVSDAQQKHDELMQRKAELDAQLAEKQKTRKAQQEAIARQARAQAVEAETQRRVQAEQEREAKRNAEIQKLENDYAQRVAEEATLKDEIKALQKAYGNIALNGAVSGQARVEQTNAEYQAKRDFSPASIKAVQAAQLMFRQFSGEDIKAVARRQALLKENLKHGLELSFPGYDIAFENMGMGEDAKVITEEDGTSRIVLNSEASIPALMSGIVQHEITHIAEAGGRYADLFQSATQAVYGDQEAVNRAMAAKEAELRAENPGISEDVTEPNNVYSQAQKEIVADAMANILGATNTAATEGQTGVYQIDWSKALSKNNPLLANDIFEWLKIRSKELSKFAKATKDKAVKAQYNNFARVANLLYDCLQDVANKNTRSVEERGAFIGNPADYGIGESEEARAYAEREAPAASTTETATATETATETAPQPKADETGEPVRTDEGYTTAPAQPEVQSEQPAQMADETGEPVRTDTGFATVPQRTEQQSEQRASEPVAGITYAQREAPEATTAAVQTEEATTTQPEQTAQESPAEAPTVRGESAEANEYAERKPEESPYVEMLDEDEDTEVEQEEQEQESAAPDTPAQGRPVASASEYVAALQQGEHAVLESGENIPMFALNENGEYQQTDEDVSPEVQDVLDAVQDAGLEAEHNANVAESVEPEAIIQNLTAYQIKESMGQIIQGVKDAAFDAFSTSGLSVSVNELMAYTENIKKYAKAILQTFSELSEADQEKLKPYTWQLEEMAENGFDLKTEETDAPQLKQNQTPQTEEEKALDEENPAQRIGVDLKKYKPYSNTHWDEFRYVCEYAKTVLTDLKNSLRGERLFHHNDTIGWTNTEVQGLTVYGQKRETSATIAAMLDEYKWSWAKISEVLNKFINAYETSTPLPNLNTIKRLETQLYYDLYHGKTGTVEGLVSNEEQLYDGQKLSEAYLRKFHPENLTVNSDGNVIAIGENLTVVGDYLRNKAPYELSPEEREAQKREFAKAAQTSFIDDLTEYSRGFLARFNNSVLLNALQSQLEAAQQSGDTATYKKLAGRMLGIIKNINSDSKNGTVVEPPIRTLLDLGKRIGATIYQNVKLTNPEASPIVQDIFRRNIVTDRVSSENFVQALLGVSNRVSDEFAFTDADTGNPDLTFHDFFLQYMTHSDTAIGSNPALQTALNNFNAKLDAGSAEMAAFVRQAREQLVNWINNTQIARARAMITNRAQQKYNSEEHSSFRNALHKVFEAVADDSLATYAQNMLAGNNDLQRMGLYRPYALRTTQRLFTGDYVKSLDNSINPSIETWSTLTERHGITTDMQEMLDTYLMTMTALDRAAVGHEAFDSGYSIKGIDGLEMAPTPSNLIKAKRDIEAAYPQIRDFANDWYKSWQNFMQEYAVNTGLVTQEAWDAMKAKNPHYAPLFRDMNSLDNVADAISAMSQKQTAGTEIRLHKAKGHSNLKVLSPTENFMNMAEHIVGAAYNNEMAKVFENNYNANPEVMGEIATRLDGFAAVDPAASVAPDVLTVTHPDGTKSYYKFKDADLLGYIKGTNNKYQMSSMMSAAGHLTRLMSALTTTKNVFFSVRNLIRDFQHSVNYGSWASNYLTGAVKWIATMADVMGNHHSDQYNDYIALGGGEWERMDVRGRKSAARIRNEMFIPTPGAKIRNAIGKIITFESLNNVIETTSRFAEYKYGENAVGTTSRLANSRGRGAPVTAESKQMAFMAAQEATVDFQRKGGARALAELRKVIPFMNPTLQGLYQDVRLLGNMDTWDDASRAKRRRTIAKVVINNIALAAASAMSFLFNPKLPDEDKKAYLEMDKSIKYSYILFPGRWLSQQLFGDSFAVALYGGRAEGRLSLTQGSLERIVYSSTLDLMESIYKGEDMSEFTTGLLEDVIGATWSALKEPFEMTTIISPVVDVLRNVNYYENNIVSPSTYNETKDVTQYYTGTTPTLFRAMSKSLVKIFGHTNLVSPQGLQYMAEQYSGVIGQLAIPALSGDKYGGTYNPLKNIMYSVPNQVRKTFTIDSDTTSAVDTAYYDMLDDVDSITQAASRGRDIPEVLDASLTDDQIKEAVQQVKEANAKGGILKEAHDALTGYYNDISTIMSGGVHNGIDYSTYSQTQREMAVEQIYRQNIRPTQREALAWYANFQNDFCGGNDFFSEIDSIYSDRAVGRFDNAELTARRMGGNLPAGYADEVNRVLAATGKKTSTVWANAPTSFSYNSVDYDAQSYVGAQADIDDWYYDAWRAAYDENVTNNKKYASLSDEDKLKAIQSAHKAAHDYAKEQFLKQYVKPTLKGN